MLENYFTVVNKLHTEALKWIIYIHWIFTQCLSGTANECATESICDGRSKEIPDVSPATFVKC